MEKGRTLAPQTSGVKREELKRALCDRPRKRLMNVTGGKNFKVEEDVSAPA